MLQFFGRIFSGILGLFGKKMDNDKARNDNATEIKKAEIESPDKVVRRNKYHIFMIIMVIIISEAFGVRLAILRFLNIDPTLINFEKILKVRNKLIKEKKTGEEIYKIYNERFIEEGVKIIIHRREFIKKLSILLNLNYRKLFDEKSELKLKYDCFLGEVEKKTKEELTEIFERLCKRKAEREKLQGYSLIGPQKDDFVFELNGKNAKSFSSQGEKKSIIFSLKVSEIDILLKEKNEYPIFLMDDIASYFDEIRKNSILEYFRNKKIQCFMTSTEDLKISGKKIIVDGGDVILDE